MFLKELEKEWNGLQRIKPFLKYRSVYHKLRRQLGIIKHKHCGICGEEIQNIREVEVFNTDQISEGYEKVGDCKCGSMIAHDFDGEDFCWCEK